MIAFIPLVVCVIGLLAYALSNNAKASEAGRIAYFCGLLVLMFELAGKTLRLMAFVAPVALLWNA